jgi:hypothetical protein
LEAMTKKQTARDARKSYADPDVVSLSEVRVPELARGSILDPQKSRFRFGVGGSGRISRASVGRAFLPSRIVRHDR